jgi:N-acetyl-anhydromuramyl-L-alanine amidase AmpD
MTREQRHAHHLAVLAERHHRASHSPSPVLHGHTTDGKYSSGGGKHAIAPLRKLTRRQEALLEKQYDSEIESLTEALNKKYPKANIPLTIKPGTAFETVNHNDPGQVKAWKAEYDSAATAIGAKYPDLE